MEKKKKKQEQLVQVKKDFEEEDIEFIKEVDSKAEQNIIQSKWLIGKRLVEKYPELETKEKPKGSVTYGMLSKKLKLSSCSATELRYCFKFAKKYRHAPQVAQVSWRDLRKDLQEKQDIEIEPLPKGKYNIIYADPPWKYFDAGWKNQSQHYETLDFATIRDRIPINEICDENCILFLWITDPMLIKIKELLSEWGFSYSTVGFYWIKKTKGDKWFFGLGNWTRANPEICIIATKGSVERVDSSIPKLVISEIQEHSKKPDEVREKIVHLVGDLPRIELFARPTGHPSEKGWEFWGAEVK